jgi:hypothetical protein
MMKYDFEDALRDLITEWHDEKGVGFEEIISALELQLYAAKDQEAAEREG